MRLGTPPKYRLLWTWDYGTRWDDQFYFHGYGAVGRNDRRGYFLDDYRRMVDFSAIHGFNGIVIWGALRSYNDGEAKFRELIQYGSSKGVRILAGCGTHGYGGVYYDPRSWLAGEWTGHDANLGTWLEKHPEYAAIAADGKPYSHPPNSRCACPSRKENLQWCIDSMLWLFSEFSPGGVQIEVGDYAVCHCDLCSRRRSSSDSTHFDVQDMVDIYAPVVEAIHKHQPEAWVVCETYSSFATALANEKPEFGAAISDDQRQLIATMPDEAIIQWVADRPTLPAQAHPWPADVAPPGLNNVARVHAGSQWCRDGIEGWGVHKIADLVRKCRASGLNGASIFGEESPASPPNEANYKVFSEFCGFGEPNPDCDIDLFFSNTLDPMFGGSGFARTWERVYSEGHFLRQARKKHPEWKSWSMDPALTGDPDFVKRASEMIPTERRSRTATLAAEAHDIGSRLSGEPCRRWSWLENWLWRAEYLHRTEE